jgi:uncharacterized membrane protein YphA (DoxX/SURF4 family)
MKKIQYISLRIFLVLMFVCAGLMLFMIWKGGPDEFNMLTQFTFSSFIIGLGSFLIWIVTIILEIREKIENK